MNEIRIAIVTVTYNRIQSLKRLLQSLSVAFYQSEPVDLIISIDKSKTSIVEEFADSYYWCHGKKIVDKHLANLGLKQHILSLGKWFEKYDALVILEDDLVVSPGYYTYTYQCVRKYSQDSRIAGISLYGFEVNYQNQKPFIPRCDGNDVFFMNCAMSWGQVWMKSQWLHFHDWYKQHNAFTEDNRIPRSLFGWGEKSWLKFHTRYCIEENKYFVFPYTSYSTNYSDVGVNHSSNNNSNPTIYQTVLNFGNVSSMRLPELDESTVLYDGFFENKYLSSHLSIADKDICINLNGENPNPQKKKYYLTKEKLDFLVIKSYGLVLRPIDENILNDVEGDDIYLYDTSIEKKNCINKGLSEILYLYRINNYVSFFKMAGINEIIRSILVSLKCRIKKLIGK